MDIKLQSALIAAAVSLTAALIAYLTVKKQLAAQKEKTEKEHASKFLENAYELRLKHYPFAFEITDQVAKLYDLKPNEIMRRHNEIAENLRNWRNTEVVLVISEYALSCSYDLEKELKKKPSTPRGSFCEEQRRRMWGLRQKFRKALREDLNLLLNTE